MEAMNIYQTKWSAILIPYGLNGSLNNEITHLHAYPDWPR